VTNIVCFQVIIGPTLQYYLILSVAFLWKPAINRWSGMNCKGYIYDLGNEGVL